MKLVVGLGNPGIEYQHNRHNIGFLILDAFAQKHQLTKKRSKRYDAYEWNGALFMKPKTFMNRSGDAVLSALSSSKIEETLIIVDDFNLEFGQIRCAPVAVAVDIWVEIYRRSVGNECYMRMRIELEIPNQKCFRSMCCRIFRKEKTFTEIYDLPPNS